MSGSHKPSAIQKRAGQPAALARFDLLNLKQRLPLVLPLPPDLPPSPKSCYRSAYRYLGWEELEDSGAL
jgi:hypothetical protein